jgi:hypothetical protein
MKFVDHRNEMVAFQAPLGQAHPRRRELRTPNPKTFRIWSVEILEHDQHGLSRCETLDLGQLGDRSSAALMANEQHAVKGWQRKDVAPSKYSHRGSA